MTYYTIRCAEQADSDAIVALLAEATQWLRDRGSDQWQTSSERHRVSVGRNISRGEVWIVVGDDGAAVATITLNDYADPEFWTTEDEPADALYVHRLAVTGQSRGTELGAALLDWAARQAVDAGKKWLRLDAWASNAALHKYYRVRGFQQVRTLHYGHRGSGALFQRAATTQLGTGPRLIEHSAVRRP
jgi:ribosomal protein S18 acetylase RimI-like enzyme